MLLALLPSLSLVLQAIQTPVQRRDFTLLSPRAERIDLLKNADYEYILAKMPAHKTRSSESLNNDPDMSNDSDNWTQVKRRQPRPASFADATRSKIAAVGARRGLVELVVRERDRPGEPDRRCDARVRWQRAGEQGEEGEEREE